MPSPLYYRDAVELAALIRDRELTAVEVMDAHLERLQALNPTLNAVVSADADAALAAAAAADAAQAAGTPLGALHGLPISFKDTHKTAGMVTSYGSPRHARFIPEANDLHVQRIIDAGALRIGKTNVPEYAAGSHTTNRVFGPTRNPYDPSRSVGGSSGGAAAALAAGFQPIADGSDMGGSLRNPASFCNVVGLRPTPGLVPNADGPNGFDPLTVAGPMARTVDDVALLLSVMARPSGRDPLGYTDPAVQTGRVTAAELCGLRVAYAPDLGGRIPVDPAVRGVIAAAAATFAAAGAHVEEACPRLDGAEEAFRTLRAAEFFTEWGEDFAANPEEFNHLLAWNIETGINLAGRDVLRAQAQVTTLVRAAVEFFAAYDVILAPAAQLPPFDVELDFPHEVDGQAQHAYLDWMRGAYLFTPLGIPGISVPGGFTAEGLPVGVQLLTRRRTDATLLSIAKAYEQATGFARCLPATQEVTA
ncbi:amidase [Arthrobacter ginkgonis]|uniref:Amidase n=1 Tax=Arthrobacter ginkgonis TaxID=1630594 RepID=A0ABP7DCG9_9MICC